MMLDAWHIASVASVEYQLKPFERKQTIPQDFLAMPKHLLCDKLSSLEWNGMLRILPGEDISQYALL